MELLTSFLVIAIVATTSAKPAAWSRRHDADIADHDLSTLLEMHAIRVRSSESWQSSQSSESDSSDSSESDASSRRDSSHSDSSESSEESREDSDDSDSSEESSEEVFIVSTPVPTTPGQESPSTAATSTVVAAATTATATPIPELITAGPTAAPLTPHVTLPGDFTPCVTHDILTPVVTPAPVTENRGDN